MLAANNRSYDGGKVQAHVRAERLRRRQLAGGGNTRQAQTDAATKIQSAYRGMRERRNSAEFIAASRAQRNSFSENAVVVSTPTL